jgi:hypothetical protein
MLRFTPSTCMGVGTKEASPETALFVGKLTPRRLSRGVSASGVAEMIDVEPGRCGGIRDKATLHTRRYMKIVVSSRQTLTDGQYSKASDRLQEVVSNLGQVLSNRFARCECYGKATVNTGTKTARSRYISRCQAIVPVFSI